MKILIIEDEKPAADRLQRQLKQAYPEIEILDTLPSIKASKAWLSQHSADLIFLDIYLTDGLSFTIFEQLEQEMNISISTPVIFTTAYDEYAIRAFQLNSLDYLLKPISREALTNSIDKYYRFRTSANNQKVDFNELVQAMQKPSYQTRFMVHYGQKLQTIPVEKAAYFYAADKLVHLVHFNGHKYVIDNTLDQLEYNLDPDTFFRINRKFIINYQSIKEMHAYPKGRVKIILTPESELESIVSLEKSNDFKTWLNS